jgi:hypothetical protein
MYTTKSYQNYFLIPIAFLGAGSTLTGDWLWAGWLGDRILVQARFSAPVQTGPGAHPAYCAMGTGSFPGVNSGRSVTLTLHSLLVPWSRKGKANLYYPYRPYGQYRASVPVQRCTLPFLITSLVMDIFNINPHSLTQMSNVTTLYHT